MASKSFPPWPPLPVSVATNRRMYKQPGASPVHLSGSLVLRSGTSGAVPPAALKNPMNQDMELLEIKFELSGDSGALAVASPAAFGGTIACDLTMGSYKLTNGSVPVWLFGRAENLSGEQKQDFNDSLAFLSYSWRLPRPLFVPAGAVVAPTFVHTGLIPDTINVRIGYSARSVFTKPKKVFLPWVASYTSKAFNPIAAPGTDRSSELDLVNPHAEVVNLQRFTGRALYLVSGGGGSERQPASFGAQYLNIRMTDSYGRPTVRNFTPFRSVFNALTRSWEMENGAQLDPEAYYIVNVRKDAIPYATDAGLQIGQAFVGMVGWREVEASK